MELRRAAEVLLRSQASPLSAAINPRTTVRWTNKAQLDYNYCPNRPAQRCLAITSRRYALKNIPTTTSAPQRSENATSSTAESTQQAGTPSTGSQPSRNPSFDLGASLGWTAGNKSRPAYPLTRASGQLEKSLNGGSSASDLLSGLKLRHDKLRGAQAGSSTVQVDRMLDPFSSPGGAFSKDMMFATAEETMVHKTKRAPMKLGPSAGRSITIGATIDVGRGFRMLEQSCARNKIKSDANKQRFHERGGLKRKRLRRERWRRKFMDGFKATVGRVKQLKNQGW